ncbi:MAG: YdcF family protein [Candidatus Omnitrophica bacterium]|nr:YdcF family protein [Candidatus Omnitrophota bacterium]
MVFLKSTRLKNIICIFSGIAIFILVVILFTPLAEQLCKALIIDEAPVSSEGIVILSGGVYKCGLPDFGTLVRLRKGLELYREEYADKIICLGGNMVEKTQKTFAQHMKDTLILNGVAADDILIQDETVNTYRDVAHLVKKFNGIFDFNQVLFVTSAYHTYRLKKILQKMGINARVISAEPYELTPRFWPERLLFFYYIIREYGAICYFKLKGYI